MFIEVVAENKMKQQAEDRAIHWNKNNGTEGGEGKNLIQTMH